MSVNTFTVKKAEGQELTHKHLVDDQLWDRLVNRIAKDESMERHLAERAMDQALAFLTLCARAPKVGYSPSPLVDIGWHTFILYTKEYASFCEQVAGRFIHHEPSDVPGVDYGTGNIAKTVTALRTHGIVVDEPLWANTGHDCGGGACGTNCGGTGCGDE